MRKEGKRTRKVKLKGKQPLEYTAIDQMKNVCSRREIEREGVRKRHFLGRFFLSNSISCLEKPTKHFNGRISSEILLGVQVMG